jgi:hypothetical protein
VSGPKPFTTRLLGGAMWQQRLRSKTETKCRASCAAAAAVTNRQNVCLVRCGGSSQQAGFGYAMRAAVHTDWCRSSQDRRLRPTAVDDREAVSGNRGGACVYQAVEWLTGTTAETMPPAIRNGSSATRYATLPTKPVQHGSHGPALASLALTHAISREKRGEERSIDTNDSRTRRVRCLRCCCLPRSIDSHRRGRVHGLTASVSWHQRKCDELKKKYARTRTEVASLYEGPRRAD